MVKIWDFLPVRNENVPHISTESLPRNVQNNTGKSFVTLYMDFSFKQLKENALVKEFSLLAKGKSFRD